MWCDRAYGAIGRGAIDVRIDQQPHRLLLLVLTPPHGAKRHHAAALLAHVDACDGICAAHAQTVGPHLLGEVHEPEISEVSSDPSEKALLVEYKLDKFGLIQVEYLKDTLPRELGRGLRVET